MKADLHCHSYFSDGKHSPDFLLQRAETNNISHLAITDHDFAFKPTVAERRESSVHLISGVEISCKWQSREIHIVGIGIDPEHPTLDSLLLKQRESRKLRIEKINKLLVESNIDGLMSYLDSQRAMSITRSHVADFLVLSGATKNRKLAFSRFLGKGGRAFAPADWTSMEEANHAITDSGGISILAHPSRYQLSRYQLASLIDTFKNAGGLALEVSYANINPNIQRMLEETALKNGLFVSAGSDFHDMNAHWTDIGKFPQINPMAEKLAVWRHPKWRLQASMNIQ